MPESFAACQIVVPSGTVTCRPSIVRLTVVTSVGAIATPETVLLPGSAATHRHRKDHDLGVRGKVVDRLLAAVAPLPRPASGLALPPPPPAPASPSRRTAAAARRTDWRSSDDHSAIVESPSSVLRTSFPMSSADA